MNRPQGVILDLDGTICRGDQLIPGAREAVERLRRRNHPIVFVTNALESCAEHAAKLARLDIPASPDEVINAPLVLTRYLNRQMPGATVFALGDLPLLEELAANFRLSEDPDEIDVVVASFDPTFDYRKLTIAFQALRRGARFLATNADAVCPTAEGELPDAAAVIGALEGCSKRRVELVAGKPSSLVVEVALERLGRLASECLIVGDNLESDILMGHRAGMTTVLVLTGVTRRADLAHAPVQPDYVLASIAEVGRLFGDDRPRRPGTSLS
ncbi:MAG: HAD-IIA family hydrolase [Chloroflexi bacterium]|nr:HAD-IIA family hydrolase [Chloroflexota bacterium]